MQQDDICLQLLHWRNEPFRAFTFHRNPVRLLCAEVQIAPFGIEGLVSKCSVVSILQLAFNLLLEKWRIARVVGRQVIKSGGAPHPFLTASVSGRGAWRLFDTYVTWLGMNNGELPFLRNMCRFCASKRGPKAPNMHLIAGNGLHRHVLQALQLPQDLSNGTSLVKNLSSRPHLD